MHSDERFLDLDVLQADDQALRFSITERVGSATAPGTTSRFEFSGEGGRSACAENFFGFNYNERQALILNFGSPWGAFGPAGSTGVSLEPGACSNASRATAAGTYSVARCATVARNDVGQTETLTDDRARTQSGAPIFLFWLFSIFFGSPISSPSPRTLSVSSANRMCRSNWRAGCEALSVVVG